MLGRFKEIEELLSAIRNPLILPLMIINAKMMNQPYDHFMGEFLQEYTDNNFQDKIASFKEGIELIPKMYQREFLDLIVLHSGRDKQFVTFRSSYIAFNKLRKLTWNTEKLNLRIMDFRFLLNRSDLFTGKNDSFHTSTEEERNGYVDM